MFERFTDRARRVVVLAQEEARLLNHNFIGTEHLLLGLIREEEGVAAEALASLDIELEAVRERVADKVGRGKQQPGGHIPFTPRAKRVLELALREALQLGHNYIGTEHLLLGLVGEGEGVGAQVLTDLGADLNRVRERVIGILHGRAPDLPARQRARLTGLPQRRAAGPAGGEGALVSGLRADLAAFQSRLNAIEQQVGPDLASLAETVRRLGEEVRQLRALLGEDGVGQASGGTSGDDQPEGPGTQNQGGAA